jgi:phage tail-like protein
MRGPISTAEDVAVSARYRVNDKVPALYQEDPLFMELCAALDELFAPMVTALDCFPAYLDPTLAPADFLDWLAGLVGVEPESADPIPRRRELIAGALAGYRVRGTVAGLRAAAAAAAGVPVRLVDGGAVVWSTSRGTAPVPEFAPTVVITCTVPPDRDRRTVTEAVEDVVGAGLPVSCRLRIEIAEES